jgi:hypothetical protein
MADEIWFCDCVVEKRMKCEDPEFMGFESTFI